MVCYPKSARGNFLPIDQYFPLIWDSGGGQCSFITSAGLKCHQWLFISAMHLMQPRAVALAAWQCKTKRDSVWSHVLFSCLWPDSFCYPCTVTLFVAVGQRCAGVHQKATVEVGGLAGTWCPHHEKRSCVHVNGSVLVICRRWVLLWMFQALCGVCTVCVKEQL